MRVMSCDSSSSEDDLERLKEAVDGSFLPQHLYESGNVIKRGTSIKPSLRMQSHETTSFNPFTIKITPEFQKHVSKHLSRILDELIDETQIVPKRKKLQAEKLNSGIKLLHSSKNYLMLPYSKETHVSLRNSCKKKSLDKIDFEKRSKEVAVSPEWVLSKQEIKHWAPETKGEVEIVKLDGSYDKLNFLGKKIFNLKQR